MKIKYKRGRLTIRGHAFGITDRPQPAVILSHGFLANERMCFKYAKLLAGMGFLAVTFDFCGGGIISRSDGRSQASVPKKLGDKGISIDDGIQTALNEIG